MVKKGNAWTPYLVVLVLSRMNYYENVESMVDRGQRRGHIEIVRLDCCPRMAKLNFGRIHLHCSLW